MKISNVSLCNFNSRYKGKYLAPKVAKKSENNFTLPLLKSIFLEIKTQKDDTYLESFLAKSGKVTKKEYTEILNKHPRVLVKAQKRCEAMSASMETTPEIIGRIAYELKKHYDDFYKNYTIVSVGTSPAPITEVMQNLGAKVIFLPITGLRDLYQSQHYFNRVNYPTLASKHPNIEVVMDYCTKKGIAKNDTGAILILDLCATGKSAGLVKQMLKERKDLQEENIFIHDVTKTLEYIKNNCDANLSQYDIDWLDSDMRMSRSVKISNVPHFYFDNSGKNSKNTIARKPHEAKQNLFKRFEDFSKPDARAWALVATHEALKLSKNNIS